MLASKFFDDVYYNNAYYARVGGISNIEARPYYHNWLPDSLVLITPDKIHQFNLLLPTPTILLPTPCFLHLASSTLHLTLTLTLPLSLTLPLPLTRSTRLRWRCYG